MPTSLALLVVCTVVVFTVIGCWDGLHSAWLRFVRLPRLARAHGWLLKRRLPWQPREGDELPGSGSVTWSYSVPYAECELLGTYGHRPVYAVQYGVPRRRGVRNGQQQWTIHRYSVVAVATSTRPFGGFHGASGARAISGNAEAYYADFVDWARDRLAESGTPVRHEGPGLVSLSWQGQLGPRRLLRALDELTAPH